MDNNNQSQNKKNQPKPKSLLNVKKRKLYIQTAIFSILACAVFLSAVILNTYPKYFELQAAKAEIKNLVYKLEGDEVIGGGDKEKLLELKQTEIKKQKEFEAKNEELLNKLKYILASSEEEAISRLVKIFDKFALRYHRAETPLILHSINFGKKLIQKKKRAMPYQIIPIKLAATATEENFIRILKFIEKSGSLSEKDFFDGNPVPLMTIEDINVRFKKTENEAGGKKEIELISFNLGINTYIKEGRKSSAKK